MAGTLQIVGKGEMLNAENITPCNLSILTFFCIETFNDRYYENNFHVLNFGFYFFLISGFALWADGFKNIPKMDLVFGLILAAATGLYPLGNAADVVRHTEQLLKMK